MSFPFYNRFSSKPERTKSAKERDNRHASAFLATGVTNNNNPQTGNSCHTRSSSKTRVFPFLGKRRKSLATLRPNVIAEDVTENIGGGRGHYKSVSQLANETAARLARPSLGAAGSRSTGNLELAAFDASPLKLGVGSEYLTPVRNRPLDARHTMFPSGSTKNSTPDHLLASQNKRSSEKPAKSWFLSRISSRPSLSARYSSADLKSASKAHGLFKSVEKQQPSSFTPQRKEFIHPLCFSNGCGLGDDTDFFTSPRVAPTPPNLSFASPDSSLFSSPVGPSQSPVSVSGQKQSPLFAGKDSTRSPGHDSSKHTNAIQATAKHASGPTTRASPASLSPETALKSPRRHSASAHRQTASPVAMKNATTANTASGSPAARPRGSHVRIGTEKVTLSVANMLEAELGVEVGDSEESSSYYDDSYEETRRFRSQVPHPTQKHLNASTPGHDSSDLPPLSPSADDLDLSFKFPRNKDKTGGNFTLDSQSPLSALVSGSLRGDNLSPSDRSSSRLRSSNIKEAEEKTAKATSVQNSIDNKRSVNHAQERSIQNARSTYLHSLSSQTREVDRLDRISERSVSVRQESPHDVEGKDEKETPKSNMDSSPRDASQLQRALDMQCARFDRLAGHLLQIIQRHQSEKVQLESQITALQKEGRRNEREIKALRKLISHSDNRSSREGWNSRRLVRVASMQSFLSNISVNDEEVDMSAAVEMLARAGRRNVPLTPDVSRDVRASMDLSPGASPAKATKIVDLRRSKTMPDLYKAALEAPSPLPTLPTQEQSPDISGLGLDFPLPEPLKLPSIASTIMSSAKGSNMSIPALTAASTAASGLSLVTKASVENLATITASASDAKSAGVGRGAGRSTREKRMAGEWRPAAAHGLYRAVGHTQQPTSAPPSAPPSCSVPALPASASYASNLNKVLLASPLDQVMKAGSPDLDAIYKKLVSKSNGLLD